jgi:hypothetical protein
LINPHSGWSRSRALVFKGNFIYIALADLVPELTTTPAARDKTIHTLGVTAGLLLLLGIAVLSSDLEGRSR